MKPPVRIILAVTSALSCIFLEGPIKMLRKAGFEPILVSSAGEQLYRIGRDAGICANDQMMSRNS